MLVGPPNVGKSSLMNRLSGEDTAIVTEVAGTTRDILRETLNLDGLLVELIDTAGLRDDPGRVEEEGIRRARAALKDADVCLWVQDASAAAPPPAPDESLPPTAKLIVVRNKVDLCGETAGATPGPVPSVAVSAATGEGIDALREQLKETAGLGDLGEGAFTARARHVDAIERARGPFRCGPRGAERQAGR